jgi:hypothetical protein
VVVFGMSRMLSMGRSGCRDNLGDPMTMLRMIGSVLMVPVVTALLGMR